MSEPSRTVLATNAPRPRGRPRKTAEPRLSPELMVVRSGLHEQAADRLRAMIVGGELPPGAPLVEVDLSAALGISRTPLREALKLLSQQGLVELRANRSPCVRPLHAVEIRDLFEALGGIERLAAELAAERMTAAELARLHSLQAEIEAKHRSGRRQAYSVANRTIHATIVRAARNLSLAEIHAGLLARAEQVRAYALRSDDRWEQSIAEHRAILTALEARDPDRAGRLLEAHVGSTAETVAAWLADEAPIVPNVA